VLLGLMLTPAASRATTITYKVNITFGSDSVIGTITTDGNIGLLTQTDISSWNLTVSDGTNSFDLTPGAPSTVQTNGSDLSATATQLSYNFGASDSGYLIFQNPSVGVNGPFVCFTSNSNDCENNNAVDLNPDTGTNSPSNPHDPMIGTDVIASVPEGDTGILLCAGIAFVFLMQKRGFANLAPRSH
jgi:hypothetical protein